MGKPGMFCSDVIPREIVQLSLVLIAHLNGELLGGPSPALKSTAEARRSHREAMTYSAFLCALCVSAVESFWNKFTLMGQRYAGGGEPDR